MRTALWIVAAALIGGPMLVMALAFCRAAAPHTPTERAADDEAQQSALRATAPAGNGADWCSPHGIPRPEVRAFGADPADLDAQRRMAASFYRHPSAGPSAN